MVPIFSKILKVLVFTPIKEDGIYLSYKKTICQGDNRAILNNVWSQSRGFSVEANIFGTDQLRDMSCKKFKVGDKSLTIYSSQTEYTQYHFQATAFHYPPRTIVTQNAAGENVVTGGYEYLIFDTIARYLKFVGRNFGQ